MGFHENIQHIIICQISLALEQSWKYIECTNRYINKCGGERVSLYKETLSLFFIPSVNYIHMKILIMKHWPLCYYLPNYEQSQERFSKLDKNHHQDLSQFSQKRFYKFSKLTQIKFPVLDTKNIQKMFKRYIVVQLAIKKHQKSRLKFFLIRS